MPEYLSPGVYVEEVSGGAKPIEAVGTSTACFIGFTERVPKPKVKDPKKSQQNSGRTTNFCDQLGRVRVAIW